LLCGIVVLAVVAVSVLAFTVPGIIGGATPPSSVLDTDGTPDGSGATQWTGAIAPPLTPYPPSQFSPFNVSVLYHPELSFNVTIATMDMVHFFDEPFDFNVTLESEAIDRRDWDWYLEGHHCDDAPPVYGPNRFSGADLVIIVSPYSLGNATDDYIVGGYFFSGWKVGGTATILIEDLGTTTNYTMVFIHEFIHFMEDRMFTIINPDTCSYSFGLGDTPCEQWQEIVFYEWIRDTICSWDEWGYSHLANPNPMQTPTA